MQRIAQIIGQLSWGGAERQLYELAIRLPEEGFEPIVYCLSEETDPYQRMLEQQGIRVRFFPRKSHFDLGRAWALRRMLMQDRIALAHAWLENDNAYTAVAHLFTHRPWIASMRSRSLDRDRLRKLIDGWALKQADLVVVNQREVVEYLAHELDCSGKQVRLVHNGVNLDRLVQQKSRSEVRTQLGVSIDAQVLLFAGRLEREKQIHLLLQSFQMTLEQVPKLRLWIAGDGGLAATLRKQSHDLDLEEKVQFLGVRDDLPDLYHAADLFVLCSSSEGLPNVVLESMGCGTPALVTPGCGCRDLIVSGVDGWICPGEDPACYSSMITTILADKVNLHEVGKRAVTKIREGYSVAGMVNSMTRLYCELLEAQAVG